MIDELRKGTHHLHKRLEEKLYSDRIIQKTLTKRELTHLLHINYLYFCGVEQALSEQSELGHFMVRKSHLAHNDLLQLGANPMKQVLPLPFENASKDTLLGMLYVTLGSNLGSRVIYLKLEAMGTFDRSMYTFYAHNDAYMGSWALFQDFISNHSKKLESEKVLEGATRAFEHFFRLYEYTS